MNTVGGTARFAACVAVTLALPACARPRPPLPPAAIAAAPAADSALRVQLTWAGSADLDLYVTDPNWETVYFANNPSRSRGRLERDVRCATLEADRPPLESVVWHQPLPGSYRIGVDFIESCGSASGPAAYRVSVDLAGQRREATGSIERERFQPIVMEFAVRVPADGGPPTLEVAR